MNSRICRRTRRQRIGLEDEAELFFYLLSLSLPPALYMVYIYLANLRQVTDQVSRRPWISFATVHDLIGCIPRPVPFRQVARTRANNSPMEFRVSDITRAGTREYRVKGRRGIVS